ncbi:tRNA-uridine aminocarboxypropyltransferase 1 [Ciona intestinalis]
MAADPFKEMKITSHKFLEDLKRSKCPKCRSSRMYFCYKCYEYVEDLDAQQLPHVELPIMVDIIKHSKELDGKSTAVHARMMSPNQVKIHTYPVIPNYTDEDKARTLLVFPGPDSKSLQHYATSSGKKRTLVNDDVINGKRICLGESPEAQESHAGETIGTRLKPSFTRIIVIDSTWNQVHSILNDERLKSIPTVELEGRETCYWRSQHNRPKSHLSTIEAMHSFFQQYHEIFVGKYDGQFDNLLFFFKFFYSMVKKNKS